MKIINFLAATVTVLSSLAVAAPLDAKREELYSENAQRLKDSIGSEGKRQEPYSLLVLKIKDEADAKEKRNDV